MHPFRAERELFRRWCWLSPNRNRLLSRQDGIQFADSNPQVPVVNTGSRLVKQSHSLQALATKDDGQAGDEIPLHQFPEDVSLGTDVGIRATFRETLLVAVKRTTVNQSCILVGCEQI